MVVVSKESREIDMSSREHLIGRYGGETPGPIVLCVAGLHGNEPAGIRALEQVLETLEELQPPFQGELVGFRGNLEALSHNRRFIQRDLNRSWFRERAEALLANPEPGHLEWEDQEQRELLLEFRKVIRRAPKNEEIYALDLHSSSAEGAPFVCVGDTLRNRKFALQFPVPIILGIEEQIDGCLAEYLCQEGLITYGFEAGQHAAPSSVENHVSVIWNALVVAGCVSSEDIPHYESCMERLRSRTQGYPAVVEIRHRHPVQAGDQFAMRPGYDNFDPIEQGETLAEDRNGPIQAEEKGMILLPLYQKVGDDGFFLARQVSPFWLGVSEWMRRLQLHRLVTWLPGVKRHPTLSDTLVVEQKIARWYAIEIFHLLGYRKAREEGSVLILSKRRER